MRFKGLDLNLLVALDVLLDEVSVSRAAERLHVSQPAMSAALMRMRDYFADPILQQHGKRMIPTAHAMKIRPKLKALLRDVDVLVSETTLFDPLESDRRFKVGISDYLLTVMFPGLIEALEAEAPGISIDCTPPSDNFIPLLNQGALDILITPDLHVSSDHPAELLFEESYVVIGCAKNPVFKNGKISKKDFYESGHVVVELGNLKPTSFSEHHLQNLGRPRKIDLTVASFLVAPELVVNTRRITVAQRRLAKMFAKRLKIAVAEVPFAFPRMKEMIQYHETRRDDPALRWFIDKLKAHAVTDA